MEPTGQTGYLVPGLAVGANKQALNQSLLAPISQALGLLTFLVKLFPSSSFLPDP